MLLSGLLALVAASAVVSAPTVVKWEQLPQPRYPDAAIGAGIEEATVTLRCTFNNQKAESCVVLDETPAAYGFGQQALIAVANARSTPEVSGDARFVVRFRLSPS